jgi:iron complex outermembrane receptor protein
LALEDLKLTGDLFPLAGGPVSFAIGGEHRRESANDNPDALVVSGQTTGATNFGPTNSSRDVWAIYWELRVSVTSPVWNFPGLHSLELGYQERYENFSDFGSTERPKFFLRWQPIDSGLTFRATYSEAFHAPTLSDLFRGPIQQFPFVVDPLSPATESQVLALVSGNPNPQPETAYKWTYGAVTIYPGQMVEPLARPDSQRGLYHIDIRAVTVQLDAQFLINHEDQFPGLVIRGPLTNDPFGPIVLLLLPEENLGRFIEEGFDYEGGWRAWLNNTTITLGVNNVMDLAPPFVAGAFENGYDEATANIKGRTWYVALKKRF